MFLVESLGFYNDKLLKIVVQQNFFQKINYELMRSSKERLFRFKMTAIYLLYDFRDNGFVIGADK